MRVRVVALVVQQLERDFPMQRRVPRAIDLAGGALADAIEQRQPSPVGTTGARIDRLGAPARDGIDVVRIVRGDAAVEAGDALDETQMPDEAAMVRVRARFGPRPVDGRTVGHLRGGLHERAIVSSQRPSPPPTEPAPA